MKQSHCIMCITSGSGGIRSQINFLRKFSATPPRLFASSHRSGFRIPHASEAVRLLASANKICVPRDAILYSRKRRDSNPRCGLPHTRFRVVRLQPTQPRFRIHCSASELLEGFIHLRFAPDTTCSQQLASNSATLPYSLQRV